MTAIVIVLTTWIIGGSYLPDRPVYSSVSVAAVSYDTTAGAEATLLFSYGDKRWFAVFQPYIKTRGYTDYPDTFWNNILAGEFKRGFVGYHHSTDLLDLVIKFGRDSFKIGPMGLLYSSNGTYLDMFFIHAKLKKLWSAQAVYGTSMLDPVDGNRRFLSFHGVEFHPHGEKGIWFGWAESVIYGGENTLPDPYYTNPLTLYYTRQVFSTFLDGYTDIYWDLWTGFTAKKWDVVGELLIDDYPYISVHGEKGMVAWAVEALWRFDDNYLFKFQYRGATRWTYTHKGQFTNYIYHHRPLGDSLGNDFEHFSLNVFKNISRGKLWLFTALTFKGEGTLYERPPQGDWPSNTFLTGVVQRRFDIGLGIVDMPLWASVSATLKIIPSYVLNYDHIEGNRKFFLNGFISLNFTPR